MDALAIAICSGIFHSAVTIYVLKTRIEYVEKTLVSHKNDIDKLYKAVFVPR